MLQRLTPSPLPAPPVELPDYLRAQGRLSLELKAGARGTQIARLSEGGGFRLKFPKREDGLTEGIIVNTAGGMTGGDALDIEVRAGEGARGLVTTQAAEKIYRSIAGETRLTTRLEVDSGADLAWAPQETILYDRARLIRELHADIAPDGRALICESLVFGRVASGETLASAAIHDRWRVRVGGRLAFADDVRLEGDIAGALSRKAVGNGARAVATVLLVAPETETRIEEARAALADASCECAASALPGLIVARFLAADPDALRGALASYLSGFAGLAIPRSWRC
jgi:urease accessory protein